MCKQGWIRANIFFQARKLVEAAVKVKVESYWFKYTFGNLDAAKSKYSYRTSTTLTSQLL